MRWMQLTLVEDDPIHYDPEFWIDYCRRTKSDGVCLSGGGCVAFYPTEIPFHHRSAWLGDRDVLGELITGCRKLGMTVLVRTDPHATYDDAKEAHPDWIAVDADGKPRRHWASPEMWVTCAYGPYNFEFMTAVHKEIMTRYRVDGLFHNRWDGNGICYCVHCAENFRGRDRTRFAALGGRRRDATYLAWQKWRRGATFRADRPCGAGRFARSTQARRIVPNGGNVALNAIDAIALTSRAPMMVADRQGRSGLAEPWQIGKVAKEYRSVVGDKPVIGLFSVGVGGTLSLEGQCDRAAPKPASGHWTRLPTGCGLGAASFQGRCTTSAGSREWKTCLCGRRRIEAI